MVGFVLSSGGGYVFGGGRWMNICRRSESVVRFAPPVVNRRRRCGIVVMTAEDPTSSSPSSPVPEDLIPQSHSVARWRDLTVSLLALGAVKLIQGGKGSPVSNFLTVYSVWLAISNAPFQFMPDRTQNIEKLESRSGLNTDLVAPNGFTKCVPPPRKETPVFDCSPNSLRDSFFAFVKRQKNVSFLSSDYDANLHGFVQTTDLARFPDVISVQFIPVGENQSTLAIYSTSIFGQGDLGKNKSRVDAWLDGFQAEVENEKQ